MLAGLFLAGLAALRSIYVRTYIVCTYLLRFFLRRRRRRKSFYFLCVLRFARRRFLPPPFHVASDARRKKTQKKHPSQKGPAQKKAGQCRWFRLIFQMSIFSRNAQAFYQTMHYEGRYHQWQIQKAFMNSIKGLRVRMGYLKNVKREKSKLQKIKRLQLYDLFLKRKKLKQLSNSMGMNTVESKDYTFSRMETLSLVSLSSDIMEYIFEISFLCLLLVHHHRRR